MRWHSEDEAPGFHFKSVAVEEYIQSHGHAWAEWNAETRPFELKSAQGSWFLGGSFNFSNTVPMGNCGGMLAGLALMHSTPRATEAVDIAAKKAKLYPDTCISPEGGCREGVQYWDYGLSFHLMIAHALENVTGDDRGLLDHPHLKNNVNFIRTQLGGHGGLFAFCDTREPFLDGLRDLRPRAEKRSHCVCARPRFGLGEFL